MAVQVPASLKAISSYLKTAQEYDKRDPIVAYFCKYDLEGFCVYKWTLVELIPRNIDGIQYVYHVFQK